MSYILHRHEINQSYASLVGGKVMGLCGLEKAGFSVPPYFVITREAWLKFCSPLIKPFELEIAKVTSLSDSDIFDLSFRIQQKITQQNLEKSLILEIDEAIVKYNFDVVSVRSSGISEDSPEYSYSGIYSSFLDVIPNDIVCRIKDCWQSAFSIRALKYIKNYEDIRSFSMAVIIQRMIHFNYSGVIFTVDPIAKQNILVEMAKLITPELIVSGRVTPTRFLLDRYLDLIEVSGSEKLKTSIARQVAKLALKAEQFFGYPQDIEFGVRGDKIIFLQSRPITTLGKS